MLNTIADYFFGGGLISYNACNSEAHANRRHSYISKLIANSLSLARKRCNFMDEYCFSHLLSVIQSKADPKIGLSSDSAMSVQRFCLKSC